MKIISLEEEYAKKTGITPQDIARFREWLKTQPHLPEKHISDHDLIMTYHCCNCSTEVAKKLLDCNLTLRTHFHNFFQNRSVDRAKTVATNMLLASLPMRSREGYKIFYGRFLNTDAKVFHFAETVKAVLMVLERCQYEEGTWPGVLVLVDFAGITLGHLAKMDISTMRHFLYFVQEGMLVKLRSLQFINAPSFIDKLLMIMRPFLKKELMDILHVHTAGSKNLDDFFPVEALPKEFGGNGEGYEKLRDDTLRRLEESREYFEEEKHKRVNESLRPGTPKTISDIFGGVEGSFKKLDID